jgi:hypothetical protein
MSVTVPKLVLRRLFGRDSAPPRWGRCGFHQIHHSYHVSSGGGAYGIDIQLEWGILDRASVEIGNDILKFRRGGVSMVNEYK